MDPIDSNASVDNSLLPTLGQPQPEEAATGFSAGKEVTVYEKSQSSFLNLPELTQRIIIRYLGFREITRLKQVCKQLRDLVENDKTQERAWYRQIPSPCQFQLKAILRAKDEQQLRNWLQPFADRGTVESLIKQQKSLYFPAQLLFINSKLMSQCERFKLVDKAEISHRSQVMMPTFSPDGRHLVTASFDKTVKIYVQKDDGSWQPKVAISHDHSFLLARVSPDGRHLVTVNVDKTLTIYGLEDDGTSNVKATFTNTRQINTATFSADGRHLVTASNDKTAKIYGLEEDGSWEIKATIPHTH
ncbi:F-box/WD repeat-containing protein [Endozoicomonas sp. ALC066]|uniref:F-box/WD repeat-containing protein n=1 Tax=Endozoicomonas sp. ALC066 TaxID=3403078 RepID=UPI003BB5F004